MPDIRYICLSDLHFGADNSLLTWLDEDGKTHPEKTPTALVEFAACLRSLMERNQDKTPATLILNGDILEMALTTTNNAAMAFERFIEVMFPAHAPRCFASELVYVPGNHDHHQWEEARDTAAEINAVEIPIGHFIPPRPHATPIFAPCGIHARMLTGLIHRFPHLQDISVKTKYPNYGIINQDARRCVVVHHGHYVESIYRLMTRLRDLVFPQRSSPITIEGIEAENWAWIDFFWSAMGRSGNAGKDINLVYKALQDPKTTDQLLRSLTRGLLGRNLPPSWWQDIKEESLYLILRALTGGATSLVRNDASAVLTKDAEEGLLWYLQGPLYQALKHSDEAMLTSEVSFVFGHTHKPFSRSQALAEYAKPVAIYNTGGWVVDTEKPTPIYGGAVVLLDEDLNAVNLRMYQETDEVANNYIRLESASSGPNRLLERLQSIIHPKQDPWASFSAAIAEAVPFRNRVLQRTNQQTAKILAEGG